MPVTLPFERTKCACDQCVACCKRQPGPLMPGDYERIKAHLGIDDAAMRRLFWRSPGAVVQRQSTGERYRVGTITPRRERGRCVFLTEANLCAIHEVAPAGCAYFDTHMGPFEAQRRAQWIVRAQEEPEYQKLREELPVATSYKPRRY